MPDLVITEAHIVTWVDKFDAPSNEVFGFEAVRYAADSTVTPSNATDATEANTQGFAVIESDRVGQAITVIRDGVIDIGEALVGLTAGDPIYLSNTDGTLATSAGTVPVIFGRVEAGWGGLTADLLLRVHKGG